MLTRYEQEPLVSVELEETHIRLEKISEMQLKSMLVLGMISTEKRDVMLPVYVVELNTTAFYISIEIGSLINLLSIFRSEEVLIVSEGNAKVLGYKDLYNFML